MAAAMEAARGHAGGASCTRRILRGSQFLFNEGGDGTRPYRGCARARSYHGDTGESANRCYRTEHESLMDGFKYIRRLPIRSKLTLLLLVPCVIVLILAGAG